MNKIRFISSIVLAGILLSLISGCGGGKSLRLETPGVYHRVQKGQTLYTIAKTYQVDVRVLQAANQIWDPSQIQVGHQLWIPGAIRILEVPPTVQGVGQKVYSAKRIPKKQARKRSYRGNLIWPVRGTLTSQFGRRRGRKHEGIDIGAPRGTPIIAAKGGRVKFSGWGPTGYGRMIIIKHPGHLTTVYAHNAKNLVKKGAYVKKGQRIAYVGKSGRATGPHLHFEVRNDSHPKNPLLFLPRKR